MPALHWGCGTGRYRPLTQKPNGVEASLVSLCRLLCNLLKQETLVNRRTATRKATQPIHYWTLGAPDCKQSPRNTRPTTLDHSCCSMPAMAPRYVHSPRLWRFASSPSARPPAARPAGPPAPPRLHTLGNDKNSLAVAKAGVHPPARQCQQRSGINRAG